VVYGSLVGPVAVFAAWWSWSWGEVEAPGRWDRGDNGLWMRRHWLHGGAEAEPAELAASLEELGIRRIYPFLGPMDEEGWPGWRDDGRIRRYDPAVAGAFLGEMRRVAPGVRVLPWTGGNLHQDVGLTDRAQRAAFATHMAELTRLGAHGVHLNVEPLPSGSGGYLDLLRAVKTAIGPDRTLSVAAYPPETPLHPFPDVHWTLEFTRQACLEADELVVMGYDTAQESGIVYETIVATWTRDLLRTLPPPEQGGCEWSMGVPAYEDDEPWHRPDAETLEHGIRGVERGLADQPDPGNFTGIAIYASWTTDRAEWAAYDRLWRGVSPTGALVPDRSE